MLKRIVNEATFELEITTTGPLLVRSGQATVSGPDMTPVLTFRNNEWQVFIPGSSLKGVIRSHSEKIVRTLRDGLCCNPFAKVNEPDSSCGVQLGNQKPAPTPERAYALSCPVCRLFGSLEFIGRISIGDAYLKDGIPAPRKELRDGVGIDRLTGGPKSQAKFTLEAVSSGAVFRSEVLLRNFECWQLSLILAVVQDMADGLLRIGGGRSRGFGAVKGAIPVLGLHHLGVPQEQLGGAIWGLGRFLNDGTYGTSPDDLLRMQPPLNWQRRGIRLHTEVPGDKISELNAIGLPDMVRRLEAWQLTRRT
ncbi:MAG: CRISPR-associated RAMP protein Csx7 [Bacillota bacterium]|nr:CRISPR-associated RAMP protein Csx7 [Bacillota bacterium]